MTKLHSSFSIVVLAMLLVGSNLTAQTAPTPASVASAQIQSSSLRIEFDKNMRSRVLARFDGKNVPLGAFSASETVKSAERTWNDFAFKSQNTEKVADNFGKGEKLSLIGSSGALQKTVSVIIYGDLSSLAVFDVTYTNTGKSPLKILEWDNNAYTINAQAGTATPAFWSYQSGSYEKRPNWIVPLHTGFTQQNYLGMNASDYGGGTPIVDVWRKDVGIGVGLLEPRPHLISLPVSMPTARQAKVSVQYRHDQTLAPGESFHTFRSFVAVHQRDYFQTL
jgi:alpha-galactosidase